MRQAKEQLRLVSVFALILLTASSTKPWKPLAAGGKHFVLVHGASHGAWCWYKLVPLLRSSGHNVSAIDLAASGIDPRQINDLRSSSDYIRPLRDFLASLQPHHRVILVGHSLGGEALSQAMERYPQKISAAVFLTASMPGPNLNISTIHQEDWTLATMLIRPVRQFREADLSRDLLLTKEKYGSVKRVFIMAEKDLILKNDFQQWMIKKNPPTQTEEILGADHMVMMSKPKQLWACLLRIAEKYE